MKLKIAVAVALIIFVATVSGIMIANFASQSESNPESASENNTNSQPALTAEVVAEHDEASDCWIIIDVNVYDVTRFINSHPGGADRIIGQCGKDATTAFRTQGGEGSHSSSAESQLESFKIGSLISQD